MDMLCSFKGEGRIWRFASVECLPAKVCASSKSWDAAGTLDRKKMGKKPVRRATM